MPDSNDKGRSKRPLPGVVGETMELMLILLDGEIKGCGTMVVVIGDGVLSLGDVYIEGVEVGPTTLIPIPEAAEVCLLEASVLE